MSRIVKVYCEGNAGSADFDIISKVVAGLTVQIIPIGGKRGAKSSIQVREEGLSKSDFKIFFRDRDFDAPVPDSERLQSHESYVYFSYRTTLENYLLNFATVEQFSEGKPWHSSTLRESYLQAAKDIKFFQATRHTLGRLRVPTDFGTNLEAKSGVLPKDLSEEFCRDAGFQKIQTSLDRIKGWSKANYDATFDHFANLFNDQFIQSGKFLVYFQGKDFMKALSKRLPNFPTKEYYQFATAKFNYRDFGDLVELRQILESAFTE